MSDREFLVKAKTYYESMIDNTAGEVSKHRDVTDPKVQSLHRLVCHETTVYLRILKKIADLEKKPQNPDGKPSPQTGIPGIIAKIDKHLQQSGNLMAATHNLILAAHVFMLFLCITAFNTLNRVSTSSMNQSIRRAYTNKCQTPIRHFITNIFSPILIQYLSPINLCMHSERLVKKWLPRTVYFLSLIGNHKIPGNPVIVDAMKQSKSWLTKICRMCSSFLPITSLHGRIHKPRRLSRVRTNIRGIIFPLISTIGWVEDAQAAEPRRWQNPIVIANKVKQSRLTGFALEGKAGVPPAI